MPINKNILQLSEAQLVEFVRIRREMRMLEKASKVIQQELRALRAAGQLPEYMVKYIDEK